MRTSSTRDPEKKRIGLGWSGGKDSMLALYRIVESAEYDLAALVTTVTPDYDRISIHGVRRSLLRLQAAALGYPLIEVPIPRDCTHDEYKARTHDNLLQLKEQGISAMAYGDIFLEDIRAYREEILTRANLTGIFPLWGECTADLARTFIELGFQAILACVSASALDESFAGRTYSTALLDALPAVVDPCGENGEFHTFVYHGPLFSHPVVIRRGEIVMRDDLAYYCDLLHG